MTHADVQERLDRHNVSVDKALVAEGACGTLHLPSGRRCTLPVHHQDSCHFQHQPTPTNEGQHHGPA